MDYYLAVSRWIENFSVQFIIKDRYFVNYLLIKRIVYLRHVSSFLVSIFPFKSYNIVQLYLSKEIFRYFW